MVRIPEHPKVKPEKRRSIFSELEEYAHYWGPGGTAVRLLQVFTVSITIVSALLTYLFWHTGISNRDASMLLILICMLELWLSIGLFIYSAVLGKRSEPVLAKLERLASAGRVIIWAIKPLFRGLREHLGRNGSG